MNDLLVYWVHKCDFPLEVNSAILQRNTVPSITNWLLSLTSPYTVLLYYLSWSISELYNSAAGQYHHYTILLQVNIRIMLHLYFAAGRYQSYADIYYIFVGQYQIYCILSPKSIQALLYSLGLDFSVIHPKFQRPFLYLIINSFLHHYFSPIIHSHFVMKLKWIWSNFQYLYPRWGSFF